MITVPALSQAQDSEFEAPPRGRATGGADGAGARAASDSEQVEPARTPWPVITVAAAKGGVGKTTLAYELAAALGAVLMDCDWDAGGATRLWGDDPSRRLRSPVLTALLACAPGIRGPLPAPPRTLEGECKPGLLPMDTRLSDIRDIDIDRWRYLLTSWTSAWQRPLVIDTHPGLAPLSDAAMAAANLVVVPLVYGAMEITALHDFLQQRGAFPILLVPYRKREIRANGKLVEPILDEVARLGLRASPPIGDHPFLSRRAWRRSAVCLTKNPGRDLAGAAEEFRTVARHIVELLRPVEDHHVNQ